MTKKLSLLALSVASALSLAACGGGGDSSSSSSTTPTTGGGSTTPTTQQPVTGTQTTPQYGGTSAQLAAFTTLNQYRTQCGFPALSQNTVLDTAAQAHAAYMSTNGVIADTETSGKAGFTGVTYKDRAVAAGYPNLYVGGVSGGYYTNSTLTDAQYGQQHVLGWLGGVYHIAIGAWPSSIVGIGVSKTTFNGFPDVRASISFDEPKTMPGNMPLTFPCQGTTGVAYSSSGETPAPPNTTGPWGTPIAVAGNATDTIVLQTGTMTDTNGHTITLQLLNSSNDPNKLLPAFEAVAYPASPLQPNTAYTVNLTGTVNGTAFSRSFTFTTGNVAV
ncbi:CAP domain-containing protein [Ralstonia sp. ASV6]|uniref:CAP domain-containing protein n=1 Tax=Ralstonia sp. ASV6 TaxID=2795124 RepID=UPI0018EDC169|nr:CAP domain-containing protein [Ralstonia sp. ASV6]